MSCCIPSLVFLFQAEDGIRDFHVTGVQTCALPILMMRSLFLKLMDISTSEKIQVSSSGIEKLGLNESGKASGHGIITLNYPEKEIGRASCRERVARSGVAGLVKEKEVTQVDFIMLE